MRLYLRRTGEYSRDKPFLVLTLVSFTLTINQKMKRMFPYVEMFKF